MNILLRHSTARPLLVSRVQLRHNNPLLARSNTNGIPRIPQPFGSSQMWPIAKVFLYGSLVYMIMHWAWWKLETDELQMELSEKVDRLESELTILIEQQRQLKEETTKSNSESSKWRFWFWK
ncbi:hypothetical protein V1512DRAFT_249367 [Lipomyces arxii]|uniref:uncharacterized protein n=1 Tax=Lipomyces arxii TaxID=56418 RepID=UPI0034CDFE2E